MKASAKRQRSKAQILEDKEVALRKEAELQEKLAQWDKMESELNEFKKQNKLLEEQTKDVQRMFEEGILKQNDEGQYQAVLDPAESEYIRSEVSRTKRKNCMSALEAEEIQKSLEKLEGVDDDEGME